MLWDRAGGFGLATPLLPPHGAVTEGMAARKKTEDQPDCVTFNKKSR